MTISNALKALSMTDDELRVGNYILLFGGRDLEFLRMGPNPDKSLGTRFAESVEVESDFTKSGRLPLGWEHGTDPDKAGVRGPLGWVDWSTAKRDEKGVFVERVLDRRNKYVQFVQALIEAGLIGTSSEAVPDGIRALEDGTIVAWPLRGDTLTVMPVEPRMMAEFGANQLQAVKSMRELAEEIPAVKALLTMIETTHQVGNGEGDTHAGDPANQPGQNVTRLPSTITKEKKSMNIMDTIKTLVPGLSEEQYQQLGAILSLAGYATAETPEGADATADPEAMRSLDITKLIGDLKALGYNPVAPGIQLPAPTQEATQPGKAITRPPYEFRPQQPAPEQTNGQKAMEAAYMMRFGEEDAAQKAIMSDYIGPNYRQVIYEQNIAYAKYLRGGDRALDQREFKALKVLYFPTSSVFSAVRDGATIGSIKATQVEAAGELGGFAIPPNSQSEIAKRAAGLTVVRAAGARVIQLVNSNGVEIPIYRGNSKRYMGMMRGQWGTETQTPSDQNFKMDLELVMAHVYTYKVPMSVSMIEDAANLVALVDEDIASTKAVDEDTCFLIGNGVGKPRGCLPGGVNADGLTEVVTGAALTFTPGGITRLKRALPSQYRDKTKTVFVANSASYGVIEELTVGGGNLARAFPELGERDELRGYRAWESEAMPDVAASAFPLLYGNMGGYTIVERLGMTIERFKDSNTGINKVEFHVRARIGGRIERPWLFVAQKVAAA